MPTKVQLNGLLKYYSAPRTKQLKWVWQKYGVMYEPKTVIPKALQGRDIEIIDPLHPKVIEREKWFSPTRHPALEFLYPKPTPQMHPLWHDRLAHICDESTTFHKGVDQACILTKSQPFNALPESVMNAAQKMPFKNQDQTLIKLIKLAHVLDANKTWIGKKFRASAPWHNMPIEYGISRLRKTPNPLSPVVGSEEIERSKEYKFVDFYPVYPTIDLKKNNVYEDGYEEGWKPGYKNPFLHTFFVINDVENPHLTSHEDRLARLTMWAFSHAAIQALNRNMRWGEICRTPVTVQGIYVLDEIFYFLVYQLNTLDLSNPEGVKNFVWFDAPKYLFFEKPDAFTEKERIIFEHHLDHYICERLKYNPDVFTTFFSFHLNGCIR